MFFYFQKFPRNFLQKRGFGFEKVWRKKVRCLSLPLAEGAPDSQNGAVEWGPKGVKMGP